MVARGNRRWLQWTPVRFGEQAGSIGVVAHHEKRTGKGTVDVRPGETVPLTVVLEEGTPRQP